MGEDLRDRIGPHYRDGDEDARLRAGLGRLELARVQEIVRRYLPAAPAAILDVGGATGVHAEWLLEDGHSVHLVDLLDEHVQKARERLDRWPRFTAEVGDARALTAPDASYDVVLVFGPLYHLQEADDRVAVWREAARVVRPGGAVLGIGISRFASMHDGLAGGDLFDPEFRAIVEADLATGRHENRTGRFHGFTTGWFTRPDQLAAEAREVGLADVEVLAVQGVAGWLSTLASRWDDDEAREVILWALRATEREPSIVGASPHVVAVGRRPRTPHPLASE